MASSQLHLTRDPCLYDGGGEARSGTRPPTSGRHPIYHGIRCRGGKWVSEIREPGKMTRIWLGTFPSPDMAAAAYDVAALALKGEAAMLNFRDLVDPFPVPASTSRADIRAAAMEAAARFRSPNNGNSASSRQVLSPAVNPVSSLLTDRALSSSQWPEDVEPMPGMGEFMDEEALFDMPNLLVDMAEGMLLSPPRMGSMVPENSPENSDDETLWSYQ